MTQITNIPTVEDVLHPAAKLKANRERRQDLRKYLRLLAEQREYWDAADERIYSDLAKEYARLGRERLPLTRRALGVWPREAG